MDRVIGRRCVFLMVAAIIILGSGSHAAQAEISFMSDYYSEPGVNPYAEYIDQQANQYIDPFSGTLALSYVDVFVPGNGGLDIKVHRSYSSYQDANGWQSPDGFPYVGVGWNMHFGMVKIRDSAKLCSGQTGTGTVLDNPVVELPDGSLNQLYFASFESFQWITKDRWRGTCLTSPDSGIELTSPEGVTYRMDKHVIFGSSPTDQWHAWYTTRITDRHGNQLNISYVNDADAMGYALIDTVTGQLATGALDGRVVKFNYDNLGQADLFLSSIAYDQLGPGGATDPHNQPSHQHSTTNHEIFYEYEPISSFGNNYKQLKKVIRPDGLFWEYGYNPLLTDGTAGSWSVKQIISPYGGVTDYTYAYIQFDPASTILTTSVVAKQTSGRDIAPGLWTYTYEPGSVLDPTTGQFHDKTTIVAPDGMTELEHVGTLEGADRGLYAIGLPLSIKKYNLDATLVEWTTNQWGYQDISQEYNVRASRPSLWEINVASPVLLSRNIYRDGSTFETIYSPNDLAQIPNYFDQYGNPKQVIERIGTVERQTNFTYYHATYGTAQWLIHTVKDETVVEAGTVNDVLTDAVTTRTFDPVTGNLMGEDKNGVVTAYDYWPTGDLKTLTDPDNYTTDYSNYKRGQAQQEVAKVDDTKSITTSRTINDTGTVNTSTNGRQIATGFTYDAMNRLTGIDYPINDDVTITYNNSATDPYKRITRGNYQETGYLDGMGRVTCVLQKDMQTNQAIAQYREYDAVSNVTFESYPYDSSGVCMMGSQPGVSKEYDILGRVKKITHPTGEFSLFDYLGGNQVKITNERGFDTFYTYLSYGNPDEKWLVQIDSPEQIRTFIQRNKLGQVEHVWQGPDSGRGGFFRYYKYDSRFYLTSIDNPETGLTQYTRDNRGNILTQQVADSAVTLFSYDGLGRKTFIDYPVGTNDVSYNYDDNSNATLIDNSISQRVYDYDDNDNLDLETITISSRQFAIDYLINTLDQTAGVTYPSGRFIDYQPDALGRMTQVGDFVTSISYYPVGIPKQMVYGNGQVTDYTLNARNWVETIAVGNGTPIVGLGYGYDAVGNVSSITDQINPAYSASFDYDGIDRLTVANGIWGNGSFSYDKWGNIEDVTLGNTSRSFTYNGRTNMLKTANYGSGRLTFGYDDYGNVTDSGNFTYSYNDASQLISATIINGALPPSGDPTTTYLYDGNNMRAHSQNAFDGLYYLYASNGNLIGEYEPNNLNNKEYIYFGSKQVAVIKGNADPVAIIDVQPSLTVTEGSTVTMDGTQSYDFDGSVTAYQWSQISGNTVALSNPTSAITTFDVPTGLPPGDLSFDLTVTDNSNQKGSSSVNISVAIVDTDKDGLSDYWEQQYFGDLSQDGSGDADLDGITNAEEFNAGSDPLVPTQLDAINSFTAKPGNRQNTLTWNPIPRALTYDIYWSTTPGVTPQNGTLISNVTSPYVHSGLTNGQKYYYILAASNGCCQTISDEISVSTGMSGWIAPYALDYGPNVILESIDMNDNGDMLYVFVKYLNSTSEYKEQLYAVWYSHDNGWGTPTLVTEISFFSFVNLKIDINNFRSAIISWNESYSDGINVNTSVKGLVHSQSTGWSAPYSLYTYTGESGVGMEPKVSIDDAGDALVVWGKMKEFYNDNLQIFSRSYLVNGGWQSVALIEDVPFNDMVVMHDQYYRKLSLAQNNNGDAILVWDKSFTNIISSGPPSILGDPIMQVSLWTYSKAGGWSAPTIMDNARTGLDMGTSVTELYASINDSGAMGLSWFASGRVFIAIHKGIDWVISNPYGHLENYLSFGTRQYSNIDNNGLMYFVDEEGCDGGGGHCITSYVARGTELTDWDFGIRVNDINQPYITRSHENLRSLVSMSSNNDLYIVNEGYGVNENNQVIPPYGLLIYRYDHNNGLREPDLLDSSFYNNPYRIDPLNVMADQKGNVAILHPLIDAMYVIQGMYITQYVVIDNAPVADAGPNNTVKADALVTLDGSASTDLNGSIVSYEWRQIKGPQVTLSATNTPTTSFIAPYNEMNTHIVYVFELKVVDDEGMVGLDTVRVRVMKPNEAPIANAGVDQVVDENTVVTLDGSASFDPFDLTNTNGAIAYDSWEQIAGPSVILNGATSRLSNTNILTPSFTAPDVIGDTVISFKLTVMDDSGESTSDIVNVTVQDTAISNTPPIADAGIAQTVNEGDFVYLDGSASYDPDGVLTGYSWLQTSGPIVTMTGANTATPSFIAPLVASDTTLGFDLTVTDDGGAQSTASTSVLVQDLVGGGDTTPPTTTSVVNISNSKGTDYVDITLTANEPADIYFRVSGPSTVTYTACATPDVFQLYSCTITLEKKNADTVVLEYYAVDLVGNTEATVTEEVR